MRVKEPLPLLAEKRGGQDCRWWGLVRTSAALTDCVWHVAAAGTRDLPAPIGVPSEPALRGPRAELGCSWGHSAGRFRAGCPSCPRQYERYPVPGPRGLAVSDTHLCLPGNKATTLLLQCAIWDSAMGWCGLVALTLAKPVGVPSWPVASPHAFHFLFRG